MRLRNHQRNEHYDHHHPRQAHHNSAEQPQTHDAHYARTKTTRNTRLSGYSAAREGWGRVVGCGWELTDSDYIDGNARQSTRGTAC